MHFKNYETECLACKRSIAKFGRQKWWKLRYPKFTASFKGILSPIYWSLSKNAAPRQSLARDAINDRLGTPPSINDLSRTHRRHPLRPPSGRCCKGISTPHMRTALNFSSLQGTAPRNAKATFRTPPRHHASVHTILSSPPPPLPPRITTEPHHTTTNLLLKPYDRARRGSVRRWSPRLG